MRKRTRSCIHGMCAARPARVVAWAQNCLYIAAVVAVERLGFVRFVARRLTLWHVCRRRSSYEAIWAGVGHTGILEAMLHLTGGFARWTNVRATDGDDKWKGPEGQKALWRLMTDRFEGGAVMTTGVGRDNAAARRRGLHDHHGYVHHEKQEFRHSFDSVD